MSLEKRGRGGTRGARTNSGVIVGGSMEDVSPPSYAQVMRNNRTNTGSNRNDWPSVGFLSGGTLMTDNLVTQSSVIVPLPKVPPLGPEPVHFPCPRCRARKLTRIHYEPNSKTHLMAALLCILGLWCFVCLPYCYERCVNIRHHCANCGKILGTYCNAL